MNHLEQAIYEDPSDTAAWQVYADWLQQHDDPRGELISLSRQRAESSGAVADKLAARIAELEAEHRGRLLGDLANHLAHERIAETTQLEWEHGYIVEAQVHNNEEDWDGPTPALILADLVRSPAAKFLRELWVGCTWNDDDWMGMIDDNLRAITTAGPLEALTSLTVADADGYWDISSVSVGELSAALRVAPRLRVLKAVGGQIGLDELEHERLELLTLETGGLPGETAAAIGRCKLPSLVSMTVYFGAANYGAGGTIEDIRPLFSGEGLPKLVDLGLVNSEFQDEIARELASSAILARLRTVDLSLGTMTEVGARAIVAAAERFAHLEDLDLSENYIPPAAQAELRAALPNVRLRLEGQRTPSEWGGRLRYYASVGE